MKLCGQEQPSDYASDNNTLLVGFLSDGRNTSSGFRATYEVIKEPTTPPPKIVGTCGGYFNDTKGGTIASPKYPRRYPRNLECDYLIEAPEGRRVELTFIRFLLAGKRCNNKDFLTIDIGPDVEVPMM